MPDVGFVEIGEWIIHQSLSAWREDYGKAA
jgi:hypothetical protein